MFSLPENGEAQGMVYSYIYKPPSISSLGRKLVIIVHAKISGEKLQLARNHLL
jgi:hypothetical protein